MSQLLLSVRDTETEDINIAYGICFILISKQTLLNAALPPEEGTRAGVDSLGIDRPHTIEW